MSGSLDFPGLPAADSAENATFADVLGQKGDSHDGDSVYAYTETLLDHVHHSSLVYPTLANGVAVLGGAAWTLGNFVVIVAAGGIGTDFDIHYVSVENLTVNDVYELHL